MKQLYVRAVHRLRDLLVRTGRMRSLDVWAQRSRRGAWVRSLLAIHDVDALVGLDTPWWTFKSADLVAAHLSGRSGSTVFEWGSGASTAWLADRATRVVAVEHDAGWADQVRGLVGETALVVTVPAVAVGTGEGITSGKAGHGGLDFTDYVRAIDDHPGSFDVIVIDGRAREACLRRALPRLAPDGLIVFDNVDRKRYRDAIAEEPGIDVMMTRGLTPALPYPTRTALISKRPQQ